MGNRALITTRKAYDQGEGMAVYLHWNGGRDTVEPLLAFCEARGYRSPTDDEPYGFAYLITTMGNFFGDGCSIGAEAKPYSPGDNGVYIIEGWRIVGRDTFLPEQNSHDFEKMLRGINDRQPEHMRLTEEQIIETVAKHNGRTD